MTTYLMDGLILLFLVVTCGYCIFLSRKLTALKDGQRDLKEAIKTFDNASLRAQSSLDRLDEAGLLQPEQLDKNLRKAAALATDLSVMIAAGDNIATRIEQAVSDVRLVSGHQRAKKDAPRDREDRHRVDTSLEKCA